MNVGSPLPNSKSRAATLAAQAFFVASPFVLLLAVSLAIGRSALSATPVWTDELDYWRAIYAWLHAGFRVGYSGIGEMAAPLGTLSVHGIAPILLYGLPAKLFGWSFVSIALYNALWISAGALVFCLLNRPKAGTALLLGISLMVYAPAVLYCATSMTELANYGLLIFYLAFVTRLKRARAKAQTPADSLPTARVGLPWLLLGALTVLLCCAYRITYMGLWIPLIWVALDGRLSGKMAGALVGAIALSALTYYLTSRLSSPFETGFLYNFLRTGSFGLSVRMFLSHAKANVLDYFVRTPGSVMEGVQRILYCAVAGLSLLGAWMRPERENGRIRLRFGWDGFSMLAFLTLFLPFAIVVCAYETNDWSDYRTLAPFLWLVIAGYLLRGRRLIPAVYFAGSLAILGLLLSIPPVGAYSDEARFTPAPFTTEAQALCQAVQFDETAADPFDNSVRTDVFTLETVASLAPGIGIQTGWFTEANVGQCRWILTDHLKIPLAGYELVVKNRAGSVYRKLSAQEQE